MFPRLFHIGSFGLPSYGFLVATGVIVALVVIAKLAKTQGLDPDETWNLGIFAILSALIGAKVLLILNDWSYYSSHFGEIFSLATLQAGGVFYGGLLAAIAVSWWYISRHKMPVLPTCDTFAPGIAIGHAIGRLGCFAAGCCYGRPTDHWWGVTFNNPLAQQWVGTPLGVRLQPTQLFESLAELVNFFILMYLFRHKKFDGQVIGSYLFLYGVERFFLEFLRGDPDRGSMFGGLITTTQFISILLVIAGGFLWARRVPVSPPLARATR